MHGLPVTHQVSHAPDWRRAEDSVRIPRTRFLRRQEEALKHVPYQWDVETYPRRTGLIAKCSDNGKRFASFEPDGSARELDEASLRKKMSDGDWYVETVKSLVIVFACSITTFILVFIILATCTRLHFSGNAIHKRETLDTPELILIKHHTRATRLLSVVGIMLQAMLVKEMTSVSDDTRSQASYSFSLFRPVSNLCLYFLGFMTNTHAFFRIAFILLLVQVVVVDALSAVTLAMLLNCLQSQGLRCGDALSSLSQDSLDFLLVRDKISLFLNPWLMLEVAYLGVAIGFCSSRYSSRRLSLSRPTFNVRAALAVYFPERFGAHVAPLHRSRGPRPAKQWTA